MPEFASPRIIRPANGRDIEALKAAFPKQDQAKYADRLARQADNHNLFLLAVQEDVPVGYVFVKWEGAKDETIAGKLPVTTPDLEDLFVHEEHRNRRVASRLLETAEQLAATRGYKQIGLSCSKDNTDAFALYEQRGYVDAGLEPYDLSGTYTDAEGKEQEWREQNCVYLVRSLSSPSTAAEMETNMTNNESTTTETTDNAEATTTTTESSEEKKPTNEKPLSDQVVDFAFGVALTAAEVLEKAVEAISEKAKVAQKEAPVVWESLQEKGRPAREKLVQSLREEAREEAEAATAAKTEETAATPTATGETSAPAPVAEVKPAPRPFGFGRSSNLSAEEEIKALEERVKTLESEVAVAPAPVVEAEAKAPENEVQLESGVVSEIAITEDAVNAAEPTPAESGTTLVDFTPDTADASTLSASAYAITDDEEKAAVPSQTGELSEIEPDAVPSVTKPRKSKKVNEAAGDAPVESEEPAA